MKIYKPTVKVTGDATGDMHYRSASGELSRVGIGDAYGVLLVNSAGTAPQWTTSGNLTETASGILTVTGGERSIIGSGTTIQVKKASASQDGYLGKDDFATFSAGGHNPVTLSASAITGGLSLSTQEISFRAATGSLDGYLKRSDWTTFSGKENVLTFSTGLTRATNTITSNISVGVSGGQSIYGGTAAGDDLTVYSTSNGTKGNIFFGTSTYDEVNNRFGIGTAAPEVPFEIYSTTAAEQNLKAVGNSATSIIRYYRARTGPAAVQSGDWLGGETFGGYGASAYVVGAQFAAYADGTFTNSSAPSYVSFYTAPSGSTTLIERMRVTSAGIVQIGLATGATGQINLVGTTSGVVGLKVKDAAGTWTMTLPDAVPALDGYVLSASTSGICSWSAISTTPAGSDSAFQYNNGGSLGGTFNGIGFYWEDVNKYLYYSSNTNSSFRLMTASETAANRNYLDFYRSRGSFPSSQSFLTAGDIIGSIRFGGNWVSGEYPNSNEIRSVAVGNWGPGGSPMASLLFYTWDNSTNSERMRVDYNGNIGIANSAPSALLTIGSNGGLLGQIDLLGSTSGTVSIKVAAAAGTGTVFQLPATNGTNGYYLQTNGSGVTSWAAVSSGFADPMTTRGDIIYRNASNVTARLGLGTTGQVLKSDGSDLVWGTASSGVPTTITVAAEASDQLCYPAFFTAATGDLGPKTHASLGFDALNCTLGIGCADPISWSRLELTANSTVRSVISGFSDTSGSDPALTFSRGKGTRAACTTVTSGNTLGSIYFCGVYANGDRDTYSGAYIQGFAGENWSGTATGAYLSFTTTTNTTTVRKERVRITDAGVLQVGLATGATGQINLVGTTSGVVSLKVKDAAGTWTMTLPDAVPAVTGYVLSATTGGVCSWVAQSGGVPTTITVAAEASDTLCYPAFFTAATGDLGPKTHANLSFDALNCRLGIGCTNPYNALEVSSDAAGYGRISSFSDTAGNGSALIFSRGRGTRAASTPVTSGSLLGAIQFNGVYQNNDIDTIAGAYIKGFANETWSASAFGSYLSFITTANTTTTRSERMRITDAGQVLIGTTAGATFSGVEYPYRFHVAGGDSATCYHGIVSEGSAIHNRILLLRHQGTLAAKTAVASGHSLGGLYFSGWDGGSTPSYVNAATITVTVDGTVSEDVVPGNIQFSTANSSGVFAERMRITPAGVLQVGLATGLTGQINLVGTTSGVVSLKVADTAGTWTMTLPSAVPAVTGYVLSATTGGVCSWVAAGGGVPTTITVAAEASDTTCYPAFFTAATGDLGPKTHASLGFDALNCTLGIGCADPISWSRLELTANSTVRSVISGFSDTSGSDPALTFSRGKGTRAACTTVTSGNTLGSIYFCGVYANGDRDTYSGAYIQGFAGENWSGTATGAYLSFTTTTNTTVVRKERVRITDAGVLQVGLATGATGQINLVGTTSGTVSLKVADAAGTWTMTLPDAVPASSGYVLSATTGGVCSWVAPGSGANTALSNLASVAINTTLLPGSNDGAGLGSGTYSFSDLFLASGGVINWANGDVTATHATDTLTIAGASSIVLNAPDTNHSLLYSTSFGTGYGSSILLQHGRGTRSSYTALGSGDNIGGIYFGGTWDTNTGGFANQAYILGNTTQAWSNSNVGCAISFYTTANATATAYERLRIDNNGRIGIGCTNPISLLELSTDGASSTATISSYGTSYSQVVIARGKGTRAGYTAVQNTDTLGALVFGGTWDTSSGFTYPASIVSVATQSWSNSNVGCELRFYTTANTTASIYERMRITNDGILQIGLAGAKTGQINLLGTTSGTVSLKVKDTAGTWSMTLPDAVPASNGYVLSANTSGVCSWVAASSGTGDVVGPSSATNEGIARFDTTTGKLIQNSLAIIGDDGYISIPSGQKYKINGVNLSATDVGAEPTLAKTNLTETSSSVLTISNGSNSVMGASPVTIQVKKASASQDGYLGKDNWSTFNSKLTDPMTANGDLITRIGGVVDNLAIGSSGQILTVSAGLPAWADPSAGTQLAQLNSKAYVHDTGADGYFAVVTEGSERLRVDNTGKVGIGIEVPTSMLDVAGDIEIGVTNWVYYGDPTTDGTWRTGVVGGEFIIEKRESGLWVTKGTFN